jgi:cation diffusion facilitator CzcD-associated flavoprotein CzcO
MCTGQLSAPRQPDFPGLEDFAGEWVQTSRWRPVAIEGRRVGVIGTGSSGVQTITAVAPLAEHLHVFQRTAHYSVPARNRLADEDRYQRIADKVPDVWDEILRTPGGLTLPPVFGKAADYSPEQQQAILEERWAFGGQVILATFADQATNAESNRLVVDFVRRKSRERIADPALAGKLLRYSYPIGTRRICIDTGYYEVFNRPNVTLVDVREDPIERITPTGIRLRSGEQAELDTIIFALGFRAFTGALDAAGIVNGHGVRPSEHWARGPRTYLGLTTVEFPNLFLPTGPGSPSVLANMNMGNVVHLDFVADLIGHMDQHGYATVEPTPAAVESWCDYVAGFAASLLRLRHDNYMVHVNADDGSRVFMPFAGGMGTYVERLREVAASGYRGFAFGR